jgi:histidinol dehydrogenase
MEKSFMLIVDTLDEAITFSNEYSPEHLILSVQQPEMWVSKIKNAGSVFLGNLSSVVFGDYASGTNHTLPTGGTARSVGGLTVESFMKPISFQTISPQGYSSLSGTVRTLARVEGLEAHARAIEIRDGDARND